MQRGISFSLNKNNCMPLLRQWAGVQRFIWNAKLRENEYFYSFAQKFMPAQNWQATETTIYNIKTHKPMIVKVAPEIQIVDQQYSHFKNKELTPWLFEIPSQVLRNAATEWHKTQWAFMRGECGPPQKKHRDNGYSLYLTKELFRFEEDAFGNMRLWVGTDKFPVGFLNLRWHRRDFHQPISIRIKATKYDKWTLSFSYDDGEATDISLEEMQKTWVELLRGKSKDEILSMTEGLDRGVKIPVATSTASFGMTKKGKTKNV